ncbi:MAG TPA: radical SAM protein [Candidatus Ozemobacteraceae bacterium]|nr:radical SAM protein [Candidatus Ozemobacteraceae bacterium]
MKIALVNPPFLFPSRSEFVYSHVLGLRSLSAFLKARKHDVVFIDALMKGFQLATPFANGFQVGLSAAEIAEAIPLDVDLIGVSAPFSQLAPLIHDLIRVLRRRFPRTTIILGGVYPSTQPELAITSDADYIVIGEGELAIGRLADGVASQDIQGLYGRDRPLPASQPATAERPENLDELPFPDCSIPDIDRYFSISPRMERGKTAALVTSRGCPFDCEFCSVHPICGRKWRARSAHHVLEEIAFLVENHGIRNLEFEDDNFTLNRGRAAQILEGICRLNERGAGLSWKTPNGIRIDTLDSEFINLMKRANCAHVTFALEHGDEEMLAIMNKKLDRGKAYDIIAAAIKAGIPEISIFIIVGYPGETLTRFRRGMAFLRRFRDLGGKVTVVANMAQPYPGTRLLERCLREGLITDPDIANFLVHRTLFSTEHVVGITTSDFDTEEVLRRKRVAADILTPKWKRVLKNVLPWSLVSFLSRVKHGRV